MSEIIHTALRFTDEENKIETLKLAINEGLDSGIVTNFDPQKHLEKLKAGKSLITDSILTGKTFEVKSYF